MGCCIFTLLLSGGPRLALIIMWVFTPWVTRTFGGRFIIPLLGLIFLPLTTVMYVLVSPGGVSTFEWLLLALGFFIDLGAYGSGAYSRYRQ